MPNHLVKRMRVLHVYKDYPPVIGGIENHLKLLAENQASRGLQVTVLVTNRDRHTADGEIHGVRVVRAGRLANAGSTPLSPALFSWLRRLPSDVTHLHFPYPPGEVAHLLFGASHKMVVTYHSDVIRQRLGLRIYHPILLRLLNRADRVIVASPNYIQSSPYLSRIPEKCEVIPYGIEWVPFAQAAEEDQEKVMGIRRRYGQPLLLFVGRLRYYKGLNYLLRAMQTVPGRLVIVGTGPEEETYRAVARDLGVGERIFFAGDIANCDLPSYYRASDIFVLPASHRSEAFGLVQLEAMAAATPVICTELGTGTSFVNQHQQTGLVVPPRDTQALAAAIKELIDDPERRRRMGERGQTRVEKEFSKDLMIERTVDLYARLLKDTTEQTLGIHKR